MLGRTLAKFPKKVLQEHEIGEHVHFPFLYQLTQESTFHVVDYHFANALLQYVSSPREEDCALLMLLLAVSRRGDLCLSLEKGAVEKIATQWNLANTRFLPLIEQAIESLPMEIIEKIDHQEVTHPLCVDQNRLYLQKNWFFETKIIEEVRRLISRSIDPIDCDLNNGCNKEQRQAVEQACNSPISVITGGPGTGKSYTAAVIVEEVCRSKEAKVILAAPTGKAASHLESRLCGQLSEYEVGTLHSMLQVRTPADMKKKLPPLNADLIIVDECSMIDVTMFAHLLSRIGEKTRVVLMGDADQLASVEQGAIFSDLVASGVIPTTRLKKSMRCEQIPIIELAEQIKKGEKIDTEKTDHSLQWIDSQEIDRVMKEAIDCYYSFSLGEPLDPKKALEQFESFRILSCLRKRSLGIEKINRQIYNYLIRKKGGEIPVPIIALRNDPSRKLFNGMTGILFKNSAYFLTRGGEIEEFNESMLPPYEYAYCLSVHKSQGSEYDHVLLLVPEGTEVFGKEILYTGVTRAKKTLKIIGDFNTVQSIVEKDVSRFSGIQERLRERL